MQNRQAVDAEEFACSRTEDGSRVADVAQRALGENVCRNPHLEERQDKLPVAQVAGRLKRGLTPARASGCELRLAQGDGLGATRIGVGQVDKAVDSIRPGSGAVRAWRPGARMPIAGDQT